MLCKHVYLRQILRLQTIRNVSVSYSKKASEPDKDNSKYLGRRKVDLWREYESVKQKVSGLPPPKDANPISIFANNELDLAEIKIYGFDYDYTLASYADSLKHLIYDMARDALVHFQKYPNELLQTKFDPTFAVRGLHCDVQHGLLLKIDAFHDIQKGCVYRGLQPLSHEDVIDLYDGTHVNIDQMNNYYGSVKKGSSATMHQLMDLFALPEMTLFANVIEYFIENNIPYDPEYVFFDVKNTVQTLHKSGSLHREVMKDIDKYVNPGDAVTQLLRRLSSAGKQLFLITNSSAAFVNAGMELMVGKNWNALFDVIITNARKPEFFHETRRPFRKINTNTGQLSWDRVTVFEKGCFYQEGNFFQLEQLTGWCGSEVLYFGDHVYTDLADATLRHGWRTGAIIPELEKEITIINSKEFKDALRWLVSLEKLIEKMQIYEDAESQSILAEWLKERENLRLRTKELFNPRFGSMFRTYHNMTYFTRRLMRFANIYTSSVENLLNYSLLHTFYPRRTALPHELDVISDIN